MKNQALFSSKDKSKKIKMSSAAIFVWYLRVKPKFTHSLYSLERNRHVWNSDTGTVLLIVKVGLYIVSDA